MSVKENLHRNGWFVSPEISSATCVTIQQAMDTFIRWAGLSSPLPARFQNVHWKPSTGIWRISGYHHVELSTVYLDQRTFQVDTALHELAHILDNRLSSHPLASIFGGGPSDEMLRFIGVEPDQFFPRFFAPGYEKVLRAAGVELNPTTYGRTRGPAEDFAESFLLMLRQPEEVSLTAPRRFAWLSAWKDTLKQG